MPGSNTSRNIIRDKNLEVLAFCLIGAVTGVGSALMLLRFDGGWIKAISLSGGASILIGEFVAFSKLLGITDDNKATMLVSLLLLWLLSSAIVLQILLKSFKRQETKYKIQTWEILLGDKKAIDQYYNSKKDEITKKIEEEYNLEKLKQEKDTLEKLREIVTCEKKYLKNLIDDADTILDKKHKIDIPLDFKFPIKGDFFELLPRYIQSISEFTHHISSFTDSYTKGINEKKNRPDDNIILKTYLIGLGYYVGQYLFDWRDVRVHFRCLNRKNNTYDKYVAAYKSGDECLDNITPIPADRGLIFLATTSKRSLVYSANRGQAYDTGSGHIWKDYITMVFDRLDIDGKPVLSLGVSVKHHLDHKDMLYFLSYIQIEQVIQENLLKLDEEFSVRNAAILETA
jgi:hypothetical protein